MDFKEFVQEARGSVEFIVDQWDVPDDDLSPAAMLENEEGEIALYILDPALLRDDMKDFLGGVILPGLVEQFAARKYALITSAWMAKAEVGEDGLDPDVRPSEHPDRMEVVTIMACDREITAFTFAEIIRTEDKPPMLGPWEDFSREGDLSGRMVDAVREVMR